MRFDFKSQSSAVLTVDVYMEFKVSQKIEKQFLRNLTTPFLQKYRTYIYKYIARNLPLKTNTLNKRITAYI